MKYLLLGAGLQGTAIAFDLLRCAPGTQAVTVVDADEASLARLRDRLADPRLATLAADVRDRERLEPLLRAADVVISAVNYWYNVDLAERAVAAGAHFLDLGGNNDVVARTLALDGPARARGVTLIPDCGLAPGLAGIIAWHLHGQFDAVESLRLRVGGLPQHPRPPLDYMLVFAVQGLINEYVEPAVVIRDGAVRTVPSLAEVEELEFPGVERPLEAFTTSGGVSTLPQTLAGRVRNLDYKTIRYRGHCERIRLLADLGLCDARPVSVNGAEVAPRELLGVLLTRALTFADEDLILVLVEAEGERAGRRWRRTCRILDRHDTAHGISAMMRMTGYPAAIIAWMLAAGVITERGARPQELVVPAERLLAELGRRGVQPAFSEAPLP